MFLSSKKLALVLALLYAVVVDDKMYLTDEVKRLHLKDNVKVSKTSIPPLVRLNSICPNVIVVIKSVILGWIISLYVYTYF
jgi:hypothetical protein